MFRSVGSVSELGVLCVPLLGSSVWLMRVGVGSGEIVPLLTQRAATEAASAASETRGMPDLPTRVAPILQAGGAPV